MWVPSKVIDWFTNLRDAADTANSINIAILSDMREELAAVRAERDTLRLQAATNQNHAEWMRLRVNALEVERAQLMSKVFHIQLPIPELAHATTTLPFDARAFSFDDVGDKLAKELGLPVYEDKK